MGKLFDFLTAVAAAVPTLPGMPPEVTAHAYQQQDVNSLMAGEVAKCGCAVLLAFGGGKTMGTGKASGPECEHTLEAAVWTPEVLGGPDAPAALDVLEALVSGLHLWAPTGSPAGHPQRRLVFSSYGLRIDRANPADAGHLVATALFSVPISLPGKLRM